jgi:hypothetical protein
VVCPKGYAKAAWDGVALRCQVADALDGETARPLPALGGLEPINETLHRLIGSSVMVGLASVSRRYERPSRMAVGRRSGTSRPPRAARLQARVGSGSASPPRFEPTNPASALSLVPVRPGGPCGCWPTRRCCQVGTGSGGAIGPNFGGTLDRCHSVLGATPSESPTGSGLALLSASPPTGCAAVAPWGHLADSPSRETARPLPTLHGEEPDTPGPVNTPAALLIG